MAGDPLKKGRYTEYSNKIGLFDKANKQFIGNSPEVVLSFPFKDAVLEAGMTKEDAGREERFLNIKIDAKDIDTLEDPKVLTNFKYIDKDGEKELDENSDIEFFDENGELKQNLLIKGNNLLALHTLKESLAGKVKLIYIDPPYNTGNDGFRYNDTFNHSSWLTFMKNRLEIARTLLRDDGAIFISCDDNEQAYLKVLMDEIFCRENFIATIPWRKRTAKSDVPFGMSQDYEWILAYAKTDKFSASIESSSRKYYESDDFPGRPWRIHDLTKQTTAQERPNSFFTITNPKDGKEYPANPNATWRITKETLPQYIADNRIVFPGDYDFLRISKPVLRYWKDDDMKKAGDKFGRSSVSTNLPSTIGMSQDGTKENQKLFGEKTFSFPKPESLIAFLIEISTHHGDIVLDFCVGSGTTAAVAHKMKRRYVAVEQMEYIKSITIERMKKVIDGDKGGISVDYDWNGGGSFVYLELKKYNQDFIDRIMEAITIPELEEIYEDMQKNAFLKFFFDKNEFEKDENFRSKSLDERKELLVGILDENQFYLNLSEMKDTKYKVSNAERVLTEKFYQIKEDEVEDDEE